MEFLSVRRCLSSVMTKVNKSTKLFVKRPTKGGKLCYRKKTKKKKQSKTSMRLIMMTMIKVMGVQWDVLLVAKSFY